MVFGNFPKTFPKEKCCLAKRADVLIDKENLDRPTREQRGARMKTKNRSRRKSVIAILLSVALCVFAIPSIALAINDMSAHDDGGGTWSLTVTIDSADYAGLTITTTDGTILAGSASATANNGSGATVESGLEVDPVVGGIWVWTSTNPNAEQTVINLTVTDVTGQFTISVVGTLWGGAGEDPLISGTYGEEPAPTPTTYTLTVNGGSGSGNYEAGTVVSIKADTPPPGQMFVGWSAVAGPADFPDRGFENNTAPSTNYTMPAYNVTINAGWMPLDTEPTYSLVVNGGKAFITGDPSKSSITEALLDDGITVMANPAPAGKQFVGWTVTGLGEPVYSWIPSPVLTQSTISYLSSNYNLQQGSVVTFTANYVPDVPDVTSGVDPSGNTSNISGGTSTPKPLALPIDDSGLPPTGDSSLMAVFSIAPLLASGLVLVIRRRLSSR